MSTNKPTKRELATYALGKLGGSFRSIHTEVIAQKAHELFPDAFSWAKYPDIPDKEIVRAALADARKERHGALVDGQSERASGHPSKANRKRAPNRWILTDTGIKWFNHKTSHWENDADALTFSAHRQTALRRLHRVLNHRVFHDYDLEPESFVPSLGDLASLLRCRVDASEDVWEIRLDGLKRDATASNRKELADFITKCRGAYRTQR